MQGHVRWGWLITQRAELIEHELNTHAYELDQLRVGTLVGFGTLAIIHGNMCDLGQVAHDLTDVPRQSRLILDDTRAEAVEKALTPLCQSLSTGIDGLLVGG